MSRSSGAGTDVGHAANEQLARRFLQLLSDGELDTLKDHLTETSAWTVMNLQEGCPRTVGAEAIVEGFLRPVRERRFASTGPRFTVEAMFCDGDIVVAEAIGRGTVRNGTDYENAYLFVMRIRDGKVEALRQYLDTAYMYRCMDGLQ